MNGTRRIAVLAAAVMAATGLMTATPAAAGHHGPRPIIHWIEIVQAHEPTWVKVWWTTGRRICDAEVTVRGEDVGIVYPENTGSYTSFRRDADLKPGRPDYTAFKVDADYDRNTLVPLEATLTYNTCGSQAVEKARIYWLRLPVLRNPDHDR
ncbi:hypothetical protein [Actinoplanes sp. NPDC049118]|uniref:hypothetical protein n=1 Tax=Actinoplanes sp. NPDC049118 TaxID=3155769 RepID=UPI0033DD12E4